MWIVVTHMQHAPFESAEWETVSTATREDDGRLVGVAGQSGRALVYASEELKRDRGFMLAAMAQVIPSPLLFGRKKRP